MCDRKYMSLPFALSDGGLLRLRRNMVQHQRGVIGTNAACLTQLDPLFKTKELCWSNLHSFNILDLFYIFYLKNMQIYFLTVLLGYPLKTWSKYFQSILP